MAIEIVDLPINSMVIFHSYVSLPEGNGNIRKKMDDSRGVPFFYGNLQMINMSYPYV